MIFCYNAAGAKRDRWPTVAITASEALSIIVCAARIISPSSVLSFVVSNLGYNDTCAADHQWLKPLCASKALRRTLSHHLSVIARPDPIICHALQRVGSILLFGELLHRSIAALLISATLFSAQRCLCQSV